MTTLLRNAEAAAMIGCTPNTLNFWRGKGRGPKFIKSCPSRRGHVYYDVADIEAWKAERKFASTGAYLAQAKETAANAPKPQGEPVTPPWLKAVAQDGSSEAAGEASRC